MLSTESPEFGSRTGQRLLWRCYLQWASSSPGLMGLSQTVFLQLLLPDAAGHCGIRHRNWAQAALCPWLQMQAKQGKKGKKSGLVEIERRTSPGGQREEWTKRGDWLCKKITVKMGRNTKEVGLWVKERPWKAGKWLQREVWMQRWGAADSLDTAGIGGQTWRGGEAESLGTTGGRDFPN